MAVPARAHEARLRAILARARGIADALSQALAEIPSGASVELESSAGARRPGWQGKESNEQSDHTSTVANGGSSSLEQTVTELRAHLRAKEKQRKSATSTTRGLGRDPSGTR